jgi:exonuclease I
LEMDFYRQFIGPLSISTQLTASRWKASLLAS